MAWKYEGYIMRAYKKTAPESYIKVSARFVFERCDFVVFRIFKKRKEQNLEVIEDHIRWIKRYNSSWKARIFGKKDIPTTKQAWKKLLNYKTSIYNRYGRSFPSRYAWGDLEEVRKLKKQAHMAMIAIDEKRRFIHLSTEHCRILY